MENNLIYCGRCRRLVCGYNALIHELNCPTLFYEHGQPGISGGQGETLQQPRRPELGAQDQAAGGSQVGEP